jgi:hypothetical protein
VQGAQSKINTNPSTPATIRWRTRVSSSPTA